MPNSGGDDEDDDDDENADSAGSDLDLSANPSLEMPHPI
jgi:hypothetical protein